MNIPFSKHAIDALNAASSCARQFGHDHVGAEHVFLSMLAIPGEHPAAGTQQTSHMGRAAAELSEIIAQCMDIGSAPA